MFMYKIVYLLLSSLMFTNTVDGSNLLHIGGIFPIAGKGGWQGGQGNNFFKLIQWI